MREFQRCVDEAFELSELRRWGPAALAWARAANRAGALGEEAAACQAWEAAGEAWRRDDQPVPAQRALRRALVIADRAGRVTHEIQVKLAATLGATGDLRGALELCERASGAETGLALDAWIGALLQTGQVGRAREAHPRLAGLDDEGARSAAVFRQGQLSVLAGELDDGAVAFAVVIDLLEGRPGGDAGVAAAQGAIADIALLRGDPGDAVALFERSVEANRRAGRRALAWQAEAGRVRALVQAGARPLLRFLDQGVEVARDRRLDPLGAGLRLARGMALADVDPARARLDLEHAVSTFERCGLPMGEGRARFELATRLVQPDGLRSEHLHLALDLLDVSRPWSNRVSAALAEVIEDDEPSEALELAGGALAHLTAMGMEVDAGRARAVVRRLGGAAMPV